MEIGDELTISLRSEVVDDALGDDFPDVGDSSELFEGSFTKGLDILVALGECLGYGLSDEADAETEEEGSERTFLRLLDTLIELRSTTLLKPR